MTTKTLPLGELLLLAGTRGALGCGIGLLVAERLGQSQRRAAGTVLLATGLVTTLPLVMDIFSHPHGNDTPARDADAPKTENEALQND